MKTAEERRQYLYDYRKKQRQDPAFLQKENQETLERMNDRYQNDPGFRQRAIDRAKARNLKNAEEIKAYQKAYRAKNKEKKKEQDRLGRLARIARDPEAHRQKVNEAALAYSKTPAGKAYRRKRRKLLRSSPIQKLIDNNRRRIRAVCSGNWKKIKRSMEMLGCTEEVFRAHIEFHFKPGMTWANYGYAGWVGDHHRPIASFSDLSDPQQQKECFGYENIRPLWRIDNQLKGDKWQPAA